MLGFAPLAANPIAGFGAVLVTVASPVTASGGLTFAGSAEWGQLATIETLGGFTFGGSPEITEGQTIEATGGFRFGGSPVWTSLNALNASDGILFNGRPTLRAAGKPLLISAVSQSFTVRADMAAYEITALTDNFTLRGVQ